MAEILARAPPAVIPTGAPPMRASRLPPYLRLPILFVLNVGISLAFWEYASSFLGPELGAISKKPDEEHHLAFPVRLLYKFVVIWAGWWLRYDFLDIAALTAITNMPYAYLMLTYYTITPLTVAAYVFNEVISIAIPTWLLRSRSAVNNRNVPLRGRYLLDSAQVNFSTVALATAVYSVVIYATHTPVVRRFLTMHMDTEIDEWTWENSNIETTFTLIPKLLVAGVATKHFLLNPSFANIPTPGVVSPVEDFDPATASLPQTLKANFWFFGRRTRTLIQQTYVVAFFLVANTLARGSSLKGATFNGLMGYASAWILANVICAGWWTWIADAEL